MRDWAVHHEGRLLAAHERLVRHGVLSPLSTDPAEVQLWMDCQLASMVENRFFVPVDPMTLATAERDRWRKAALAPDERLDDPHTLDWFLRAYWLTSEGERVGTLALDHGPGTRLLAVSSLYVLPPRRRHGAAGRALRLAYEAARAEGIPGLRIPTHWTWQSAVRFYAARGLWVTSWKHSLAFTIQDLPPYRIEMSGDRARFAIELDGRWHVAVEARRGGDRLLWHETPVLERMTEERSPAVWLVPETFAVGLALEGWPLIRSDELWAKRHQFSDCGPPEGLAYKIEIFEALDRRSGFDVRTPRIPGLRYRDFDDID
jgi:GNAT superfamily N-acetyltransferase